jgi:succinate dehydrogenase / fumarate reductase iron-sulfur subunit
METKTIKARVERFDPDQDNAPYLETYELEREEGMNVLRLLTRIYEEVDHGLAFMGPCRIGFCGLCLVNVNGKNVMACQRVIKEEDEELLLKPVTGYAVVRDLAVMLDEKKGSRET